MKVKSTSKILILLAVLLIFSACSTKKNTFVSRNYHTLTSYYNVYWNGDQAYQEALVQLAGLGYDNYSQVLPVFEYGSIKDTNTFGPLMMRAIEKASKAIKKHSIVVRGVEYVKYIDDAYMLMGKAYVYRHDYFTARTVFNFVISQFQNEPVRHDAMLWIARSYMVEEEFDMANASLSQVIANQDQLSSEAKKELPLVIADYYIRQKSYEEAIPHLKKGIEITKNRDLKNRLRFILAQIYQEEGKVSQAFALYQEIVKSRAPLEMDFNARLNMALSYDRRYGNSKDIYKEMDKLLKDEKNSRSFGRIYYVLSEVAMQDRKRALSIEYLEKSVEASSGDADQLVVSAVKLGDIYFATPDYPSAYKYYQMAEAAINKEHPDYYRVVSRAENLQALIAHQEVIREETLRLQVSAMDETQRKNYAEKAAKKYSDSLKKQELLDAANKKKNQGSSSQRGSWYFYNTQTKTFGYNDFVRKYGRRKLEDFWFLENKPQLSNVFGNGEDENLAESQQKILTPKDPDYYLQGIPDSEGAIDSSRNKLEDALISEGLIYFDKLEEPNLALKSFEKVMEIASSSPMLVEIYYNLYRIYFSKNDEVNKQKYADLILANFPKSEQAARISDPDFLKNQEISYTKAGELYEYTFMAYSNAAYDAVLRNTREAENRYPNNAFAAKFKFLEAASNGALQGPEVLVDELTQFTQNYSSEKELVELSNKMIEYAKGIMQGTINPAVAAENIAENTVVEEETPKEVEYTYDPTAPHNFVMGFQPERIRMEVLKTRFSDFNRRNYAKLNLEINDDFQMENERPIIYISLFPDAEKAMTYYHAAMKSSYLFGGEAAQNRQGFIISADNFQLLKETGKMEIYREFFKENYLENN